MVPGPPAPRPAQGPQLWASSPTPARLDTKGPESSPSLQVSRGHRIPLEVSEIQIPPKVWAPPQGERVPGCREEVSPGRLASQPLPSHIRDLNLPLLCGPSPEVSVPVGPLPVFAWDSGHPSSSGPLSSLPAPRPLRGASGAAETSVSDILPVPQGGRCAFLREGPGSAARPVLTPTDTLPSAGLRPAG